MLKDMLLREQIDSKKMLSVSYLAEIIGMGRAPVTDAVKRLESEDFLKIIPRQGILVREMTVQEMRDINETRLVLETYIMERIASNFSDEDVRALRTFIDSMKECELLNNYYNFIVSDHDMHMYLYGLCQNLCMIDILKKLRDRIFTVGFKIVARREGRMTSTIQEHEAILNALEKKDPLQASENMRMHLTNGWRLI
jgi:DNA-binding GntR family transcriptional regulator